MSDSWYLNRFPGKVFQELQGPFQFHAPRIAANRTFQLRFLRDRDLDTEELGQVVEVNLCWMKLQQTAFQVSEKMGKILGKMQLQKTYEAQKKRVVKL